MADESFEVPPEASKRYRMSYGGQSLGSWDTATELIAEHKMHSSIIRPVIDPMNKFLYEFRDGRTREIAIIDLRRIAVSEASANR